jgi:amino acid permease
MMASAMGTGLFSFPWIAKNTGFAFMLIYIVIAGLFSLVAMYLLMSVAKPNRIISYNDLAELAYGKAFKRISEFCVIFYAWGITICFQVVFAKFVVEILDQIFDLDVFIPGSITQFNSRGTLIRLVTNAVAISINMVFILKRDLYALRFITILGTLAVGYNTIVILITAFTGFTYKKGDMLPHYYESILSPSRDWTSFKMANFGNPLLHLVGFASTIFCYVNHQMIFPMADELANPTLRRLHKIFHRAHISEGAVYMTVGIMGYLLLYENRIDSLVLQSITTTPMLIGTNILMQANV